MRTNRGQIGGLPMAIMALVIAIFFLVMGMVVLQEIRDTPIVSQDLSATTGNETITASSLGVTLTDSTLPGFADLSIVVVQNATGTEILSSGNWTTNATAITSTTDAVWNATSWNVTYSYVYGGDAYTATNSTIAGLGEFGDQIDLIVIAVVLAIVIGILFMIFGRRPR